MLGLSVDSVYSHLAWIDSIKTTFDVDVPFPVIADVDSRVARLYGMTTAGGATATVRSVFFIDPEQTIRATITYPAAIGRNVAELLRVLDALKENVSSQGCAIPANWQRGEPTLSPAPTTAASWQERRAAHDAGVKAWYYKVNE